MSPESGKGAFRRVEDFRFKMPAWRRASAVASFRGAALPT